MALVLCMSQRTFAVAQRTRAAAKQTIGADSSWITEAKASGGYARPQVLSDSPAPTLIDNSIGFELGYLVYGPVGIGASSEYHWLLQYSSVDSSVGNMKGQRQEWLNPALIFSWNDYLVQAGFILMGDYALANSTKNGAKITYTKPRGWRLEGAYAFFKPMYFGLKFESVAYATKKSSDGSEIDLASNKLQIFESGIFMAYLF